MSRVSILLADGFEEIEAITIIDVLRRAEIEAVAVSVTGSLTVLGAHQIGVQADILLGDAVEQEWEMVVLPGGLPGSTTLRDQEDVQEFLRAHHDKDTPLAAICAAPIALAKAGILSGKRVTSYPAFSDQLGDVIYEERAVVQDGNLTTSRGPATAMEFALNLVEQLRGEGCAQPLAQGMLVKS